MSGRAFGHAARTGARGGLSISQPVFVGLDEDGVSVFLDLPYRNLLCGGEPGAGKSGGQRARHGG